MSDEIMRLVEELSNARRAITNMVEHSKKEEHKRLGNLTEVLDNIRRARDQLIGFTNVNDVCIGVNLADEIVGVFNPSYDTSYKVQEDTANNLINKFRNIRNKADDLTDTLTYLIDNCTFVRDSTALLKACETRIQEIESGSSKKIEAKLYAAIDEIGK